MRVVRLLLDGDCRYGLADDATVTLISDEPFAAWEPEGLLALADARLLPPVTPTKVVCVGLNYRPHIAEMGHEFPREPVLFLKPPTAVIGPGQPIPIPEGSGESTKGRAGVVIGANSQRVPRKLSRTCWSRAETTSARDLQKADGQWSRGFDFCPWAQVATDVDNDLTSSAGSTAINGKGLESDMSSTLRVVRFTSTA
jgi:2-keto-4-pentenoate hydratase/2-oxohepta-3-ene-1,7-dioic acid hydratase in catechol pathway